MQNYSGPYQIGSMPTGDNPEGGGAPHRHNDGSMVIMGRDEDGFSAPVLHIPMRIRAKRGEAWRTSDPDQEEFAARVVALLNSQEEQDVDQ